MKKNKGVTLIELIVSILIFSFVMLGVTIFSARNTKTAIKSERSAKRILLQETCIEEFKGWLKSSPIPGARFDTIWNNYDVDDSLHGGTAEGIPEIMVRLEVDAFEPDTGMALSETGTYLRVRVISSDTDLGIVDITKILISRHD